MSNSIKPGTKETIETLQMANIKSVMITGDHVMTAVAVGRNCSIIMPKQKVFVSEIKD